MAQMAIDCQDVSARMMELLYGELSPDDRAAVEAHIAACVSCRAELAGFQSARAIARQALDADAPPARAHQAILRAAAAAVASKQPQPIAARPVPARPSLWERFRGRWTLPTFATVGAVAVVVLASKVFLEPDKTVELGRQALRPAPAAAPVSPPVGAGAPQEAQEAAQTAAPAERKREPSEEQRLQPPAADKAPARSIAASTALHRRSAPADGLGTLGGLMKGGDGASAARAKTGLSDNLSAGEDRTDAPAAAKPSKRQFAPPPPPRAEPTSPSATGSLQMKDRRSEEERLEDFAPPRGGSGRVGAGAGAAPPATHAAAAKKAAAPAGADLEGASTAASAPAPAPAPPAPAAKEDQDLTTDDAKRETKSDAKPAAASPVARADRLFAEGHWAAAALAYRDLLRHDPSNADAARWQRRLAAAQDAASSQAPAAASPGR